MRRLAIAAIFALALAWSAVALAAAPPRAALQGFLCQRALDPPARAISVTAVMRPLPGTERMELKFELLRKHGGGFRELSGGDLGHWVSPKDPTLGQRPGDVWRLEHPVLSLTAPAMYRFRVSFRWLGAQGRVLAQEVRESRSCYQPELRPDLRVRSIKVVAVPRDPSEDRYVAVIRNAGATAATNFEVQFSDRGVMLAHSVKRLAAHSKLSESFIGPACSRGGATVVADPGLAVDDFDRTNNSMTVTCSG